MSTTSLPSRAQELLREAIELEADELYLQSEGDKIKFRYRVMGRLVQKHNGFLSDADHIFDEFKALATEDVSADENEHLGFFSFSTENQSTRVRVYWFREDGDDALVVSLLAPQYSFDDLGLGPNDVATMDELLATPQGIIVGCGLENGGHATTLNALLERLARMGKRVVSFATPPATPTENITYLSAEGGDFQEQIELLAGHFNVFALGHFDNPVKVRAAFDLAAEGHLVLGLLYSFPVYTAMPHFLYNGISVEEIKAHFLGGWSQRLVKDSNQNPQTALFYCVGQQKTKKQLLAWQEAEFQAMDEDEEDALRCDAEEKIAAGIITREATLNSLAA